MLCCCHSLRGLAADDPHLIRNTSVGVQPPPPPPPPPPPSPRPSRPKSFACNRYERFIFLLVNTTFASRDPKHSFNRFFLSTPSPGPPALHHPTWPLLQVRPSPQLPLLRLLTAALLPGINYALVARGTTVLVDHTLASGNFAQVQQSPCTTSSLL